MQLMIEEFSNRSSPPKQIKEANGSGPTSEKIPWPIEIGGWIVETREHESKFRHQL